MANKKPKGPGGAPTKYNKKSHPAQAKKLMAKHGYTMEDLADFFAVATSTIYKWQSEHPEFSEAIKQGRYDFDTDKVENALLNTALGYEVTESHVEVGVDGKKKKKVVKKHIGGQAIAQIFWLKNRAPDRWKDKLDVKADATVKNVQYTPDEYARAQEELEGQLDDLD